MQSSSWVLAQDHDETNMPGRCGGYSEGDGDDNFVDCRSVAQIYQYGSAEGVECRVCSSTCTSGSWRRGWRVTLHQEEDTTLKEEDRPLYANLCNRYVFMSSIAAVRRLWWAKFGCRTEVPDSLFDHPMVSLCMV